jgi:hypothetical protein
MLCFIAGDVVTFQLTRSIWRGYSCAQEGTFDVTVRAFSTIMADWIPSTDPYKIIVQRPITRNWTFSIAPGKPREYSVPGMLENWD